MEIAIFDPRAGASGDMVLGCLLGVTDSDEIINRLTDFVNEVGEVELRFESQTKNEIMVNNLDVVVDEDTNLEFGEIRDLVNESGLSEDVKESSIGVFEVLRCAEKQVHGEDAGFHEVGQIDALVDVVGSAMAFEEIGAEKIYSTPINVGAGFVETQHGSLPVPAPATEEILKNSDLTWGGGPIGSELLTPTGAALLAYYVDESVRWFPMMRSKAVSRGAGSRELEIPNYLSLTIGEESKKFGSDEVVVIETNVDDVDGEVIGYLKQRLMKNNALDVSVVPVHMKKDRSGFLVKVLAKTRDVERLSETLVEELGTLGVRLIPNIHRLIAERDTVVVEVLGHSIEVKLGSLGDEVFDFSAEYDDCVVVATEEDVPLREVKKKAENLAKEELGE